MLGKMLKTVTVSEKGQITIPKEILELLEIQIGDRLAITAKDKKILIQKSTSIDSHFEDGVDDRLRYTEASHETVWNSKRAYVLETHWK